MKDPERCDTFRLWRKMINYSKWKGETQKLWAKKHLLGKAEADRVIEAEEEKMGGKR